MAVDTTVQEKAIAHPHPTDARQFLLHAKALHGNAYDGHTLGPVIADLQTLTASRCAASSSTRATAATITPTASRSGSPARSAASPAPSAARCAAVEPVIGHVKAEHRMGHNYLKGRAGDRANAVLAAAGYNFSLLLRWFRRLLRALILALLRSPPIPSRA